MFGFNGVGGGGGELNTEMKLSQLIELFMTKRMPPIRSLSDLWFSSCAS